MNELYICHNGDSIRCCRAADGIHLDIYVNGELHAGALTLFPEDTEDEVRAIVVAWREERMPGLTEGSRYSEVPI